MITGNARAVEGGRTAGDDHRLTPRTSGNTDNRRSRMDVVDRFRRTRMVDLWDGAE